MRVNRRFPWSPHMMMPNPSLAWGRTIVLPLVALITLTSACGSNSGTVPPRIEGALRIATYNVHYIELGKQVGAWSVDDWHRRKGPLDNAFKALKADIVAFQEMESFAGGEDGSVNLTLDWLLDRNSDYAAAAIGDWREFPSTQPIFYRTDRLVLQEQGWFFFSDTPDVIYSRTFNGSYPAFASWASFRDRKSGEDFHVFNVHFEYKSGSNRRLSADLVVSRIAPLIEAGKHVFLVGDLNGRTGSDSVEILKDAGFSFPTVTDSTYHFNRGINLFRAIDHLAYSTGIEPAGSPVVVQRRFDGEWPSDHYPLLGDFRWGPQP